MSKGRSPGAPQATWKLGDSPYHTPVEGRQTTAFVKPSDVVSARNGMSPYVPKAIANQDTERNLTGHRRRGHQTGMGLSHCLG